MPQTLSGLLAAEARSVMEMEEVLVRRRASWGRTSSKAAKASFFGPTLSTWYSLDRGAHLGHILLIHGPVDAVLVFPRLLLGERAPVREARETFADVALGLFERLNVGVAGDDLVTGLGGELDDAGAHRADAEDADGADAALVH